MHPDHRYIDALLNGEDHLVREIYVLHAPTIKTWVIRNKGNFSDAEDLMQDALMTIARQARRTGWQLTCPFGAFLFLICKRKWLNELEHRRISGVTNTYPAGLEGIAEAENLADETLKFELRFNLLQRIFGNQTQGCRKLLQLSWSGTSMEEVAKALGVTYGYARKKKSECMARLIDEIKNDPGYQNLRES